MKIRITVTDACDTVELDVAQEMTCSAAKAEALDRCIGGHVSPADYMAKFRGAAINESSTLESVGVPDGGSFVVMPIKRHPVR
jgi:hypothetical protein